MDPGGNGTWRGARLPASQREGEGMRSSARALLVGLLSWATRTKKRGKRERPAGPSREEELGHAEARPSWARSKRRKGINKILFFYSLKHIFKSNFNSNSNSFKI